MASTDFTGRTVDLLIFQGVEETGNQPITTSWGTAGQLCTGVQKIAQSWTALFLTDQGSVLNDPTRGSTFLQSMRFGRIQVDEDIPAEFAIASAQVRRTMGLDTSNSSTVLEDDERLARAELLDYSIERNTSLLRLKVRLHSVAGDSRVIFLPISVPVR
jgi:hypothetical protein